MRTNWTATGLALLRTSAPVAALLLALASPALAADLYVSPGGDDATGNGTAAKPWRTIGFAVTAAGGGATICLMDDGNDATDDYTEAVILAPTGWLTLAAAPGNQTRPRLKPPAGSAAAITVAVGDVTITGLDIHGVLPGAGVLVQAGASEVKVSDCRIPCKGCEKVQVGVQVDKGMQAVTVLESEFHGAVWGVRAEGEIGEPQPVVDVEGCSVTDASDGVEITDRCAYVNFCEFSGCTRAVHLTGAPWAGVWMNEIAGGNDGIYAYTGGGSGIESNTISGAMTGIHLISCHHGYITANQLKQNGRAIWLEVADYNVVHGNTITASGQYGIDVDQAGNNILYQNEITASSGPGVRLAGNAGGTLLLFNRIAAGKGAAISSSGSGNTLFLTRHSRNQRSPSRSSP